MSEDVLHSVCAACGGVNRIPTARLQASAAAKCGKCGHLLFPGEAEAVTAERFQQMASRSDIPVLADFWAPWCGPCRALAPVVEHVAQSLTPHVKVVKVNVDEAQALAQRLGIRAVPTLAVFQHGREAARTSGVMDQKTLTDWTRQAAGLPEAA
jgi:thioredoxin 2